MSVSVIVPWRPGCLDRESAWQHLQSIYEVQHPSWQVVEARAPDGPWVKALALRPGFSQADGSVLVIADADVWCDGLLAAVRAVQSGRPWAIPHDTVNRLDADATETWKQGGHPRPYEQYRGVEGGGFVVLPRDLALAVPPDPRFVGWGQEDECWALALHVLAGKPWRGTAPLWHLWHQPQPRQTRRRGSESNWGLRKRYYAARRNPRAMSALIAEANDGFGPDQPAVHDLS